MCRVAADGGHRGELCVAPDTDVRAAKGTPMGKSFFLGNDAELYAGSNNFSTLITATPLAFGLSVPLATEYAALNATYAAAYLAALAPETRTKPKIIAKDDAK